MDNKVQEYLEYLNNLKELARVKLDLAKLHNALAENYLAEAKALSAELAQHIGGR